MGQLEDFEKYVSEAIVNIRADRALTSALLTDLFKEIKKSNNAETHKDLGLIASKYVETLQRSNEQLVKLTAILNKKQSIDTSLNDNEKTEILDMIQGKNK